MPTLDLEKLDFKKLDRKKLNFEKLDLKKLDLEKLDFEIRSVHEYILCIIHIQHLDLSMFYICKRFQNE